MNDFQRDAETRYGGTVFNLKPVTQDPTFPRDGDSWFRIDLGIIKIKLDGVIYGLALIDTGSGKLIASQTPDITINHVFVVNSEAEMLALSAVVGDVAIRTDNNTSYILIALPPSTLSNWDVLTNITASVSSVNGKTGVVVLTTTDIDEGTRLYYTQARFDSAFGLKTTSDLTEGSNLYYTTARFDARFGTKTTDNLTEGAFNLYYTNARFDTRFASKTTSNLTEGSNLYYSQARFDSAFSAKTTDNLSEGVTNLYYTTARFNNDFSTKTTTNLAEGSNLYYTTARANTDFDNRLATKTTDNLSEGSLNLYFTNARADARITAQKGQPNGLATLDGSGLIPVSQLPGDATVDINVVSSQAAMLALTAQKGDIAKRTDTKEIYVLRATPASTLSNWELTATDYNSNVDTVNGYTRTVVLTTSDIAEGTNLYWTQGRFDTAFAGKSTSDLTEGSNLYFTNARFDSRLATKTTDNLSEGSLNLYYTTARANTDFDTRLATKTTSNLAEGSNLYYTSARANADFDTRLATKTTDNLAEGLTNLYYTTARFDTRFASKTTSDLTEGSNLYFTNARADARISIQKGMANGLATLDSMSHVPLSQISITTDNVPEGTSNLYYTDARADARIALQKGAANGIATLDAGSKIPASQLPAIAITDTFVVASQVAMLALTAQTGDIAIRTDLSESFVLQGTDPTMLSNWQQLLSPAAPVQSVNGFTGNVVLTTTDIAEGTNLYYTDARARASISGTAPISYNNISGVISIPKSDATHDGYLSQGDWTTFNGKEPAITAGTTLQYWRGDKTFQTLDTSAVPEGSNLYYTDARFDTRFASKSTTNLSEGTNLYFTDARARLAISATSPVLYDSSTGIISLGTVPIANGGTNKTSYTTGSIPYFDGTRLNEDNANLYWDGTNHRLGIGTASPNANLDIVGDEARRMVSPAQITANQNNYSLGLGTIFRLTSDANNRAITGLSGGYDGRIVTLINANTSNFTIVIDNQNASSTASNRFQLSTNANINLSRYGSLTFAYDATTQVWRDI